MSKFKIGDLVTVFDGGTFPSYERWFSDRPFYIVTGLEPNAVELIDDRGDYHDVTFINVKHYDDTDYDEVLKTVVELNISALENIKKLKAMRKELEANVRRNALH